MSTLGPVVDATLQGHVLHRADASVRLAGLDASGRVLGRACNRAGRETGRELVPVFPEDWPGLRPLLAPRRRPA